MTKKNISFIISKKTNLHNNEKLNEAINLFIKDSDALYKASSPFEIPRGAIANWKKGKTIILELAKHIPNINEDLKKQIEHVQHLSNKWDSPLSMFHMNMLAFCSLSYKKNNHD